MAGVDSPKLLAFLGNTGPRYARTRHNVAWMLLDHGPFAYAENWQQKFKAVWARAPLGGEQVTLLKPQTMMNLSGESVQAAMRFFRFLPSEILVAHDDVELPFGAAAIRLGGGLAGHNGLRSVTQCLGTRDFWRLRIGVDRPGRGDLHNHVLGRFSEQEEALLPGFLSKLATLLDEEVFRDFGERPRLLRPG
jgi:PTH1 family peptidyl-tRNA hydrolase